MKKGISTAVFALVLSCSPVFAYEGPVINVPPMTVPPMQFCFDPYIGVNGAMRHMSWPDNFGGNVFKKEYPEGDLYLGSWFTENLGLQVGYKTTVTRTQVASLSNTLQFGLPTSIPPEVHLTQARFKGWHGEIIGYIPLLMPNCAFLYGTIGFTRFQLYQTDRIVQNGTAGVTPILFNEFLRTFKSTKTVLSLSIGAEYQVCQLSSLRFFVGWDNTGRFKSVTPLQANSAAILQVKDSYTLGIGVVFRFY